MLRLGFITSANAYMSADEQIICRYANKNQCAIDQYFLENELSLDFLVNASQKILIIAVNVTAFGKSFENIIKTASTYTNFGASVCRSDEIKEMLSKGYGIAKISKLMHRGRESLKNFIISKGLA